ncbi:hypothetical protein ES708_03815 [subsurface metagenome]
MDVLKTIVTYIDKFSKYQAYMLVPFPLGLILITMYDIVGRQLGLYTAWAFDTEWFIYGFIMMLGMAYAILKDQHVKIDLLTARYSKRMQSILVIVSYLVFTIPVMVIIAINALGFAMDSKAQGETVLTAWYFQLWPIKLFIFIGIIFMLPQCLAEIIRHAYFLIKKEMP